MCPTPISKVGALKDARLNSTHYILMKINNKKELKRIAEEKSGHLDYKDFLKMYNYCTKEPYSFMLIDTRPTATIPFKKTLKMSNKFKDEIEIYYNKLSKVDDILDESNNRLNKLNDKIIKIKKVLDDKTLSDDKRNKLQIEIKDLNRKLKEKEKIKKLFIIKIL